MDQKGGDAARLEGFADGAVQKKPRTMTAGMQKPFDDIFLRWEALP